MGHENWKTIDAIRWKEGHIDEIKVRPDDCPIPYEESADTKGLELDEHDFCICRRDKLYFKGPGTKGPRGEVMHNCPYLRGWEGPYLRVICSYPEKEDIS